MLKKISHIASSLYSDKFFRTSLWMTIANLFGGILGYGYQILIGRMLVAADFALFSAIMALYIIFSTPLSTLLMAVSKRVTFLAAKDRFSELKVFYWKLTSTLLGLGIVLILVGAVFIDYFQEYLKSPTASPIWIFYCLLLFTMVLVLNNAFFQGLQHFTWLANTSLFGIALKALLGWGLIAIGYGVSGALGGFLISSLLVTLLGIFLVQKNLSLHQQETQNAQMIASAPRFNVLPILIANLGFVLMTQLDMVLINWYFPPQEAGSYAAASVLGKAILYLPGGIVLALFPMVAKNHATNVGSFYLIRNAVIITLLMCGSLALAYWLLGDWLISLFYGNRYIDSGKILRLYGLVMLPMALVMVAEHFLIAQGRTLFCWLYLFILPFQFLAVWIWHQDIWMIMVNIGVSGAILTFLGYGILFQEWFKVHKKTEPKIIKNV
jgi:O-antigen/teichoic acid export membrane protein